jgi:hypothetical protein
MTQEYKDLFCHRLNEQQHGQTCGYWFTVRQSSFAHTAFGTRDGLDRWLSERGLSLKDELPEPGTSSRIIGSYRQTSHMVEDAAIVEQIDGIKTRVMSNGHWVVGVIVTDADGVKHIHACNPNVKNRTVFDYIESRWMMGSGYTGDVNGNQVARVK